MIDNSFLYNRFAENKFLYSYALVLIFVRTLLKKAWKCGTFENSFVNLYPNHFV
jgi:hypothetical protein